MKKALITGIRGQDGAYLAKLLLDKGYDVIGVDRRSGESSFWRLKYLGIEQNVRIEFMDVLELTNIYRLIKKEQPDEIYNLAAQSFVGVSFEQPILTSDINGIGVLRILEAVRDCSPHSRFYQASTSEMFGKVQDSSQDEKTPFHPRSPYGISKLFAHWVTVNYREAYHLFACSGILFNHESPLRGKEFVTRKIARSIAGIALGHLEQFQLGNLSASRDWGYAPEYVEGMWRIITAHEPDDYVLATGETHTVKEFVEAACAAADIGIIWEGSDQNEIGIHEKTGKTIIQVSPDLTRPAEVDILKGNPQKAEKKLGWKPQTTFHQLVSMMVQYEIEQLKTYEKRP